MRPCCGSGRFAVDVDGVRVAVFPAAQGVRGGNQDDFAFQMFRKQFVEVAHLPVELGFFHVGDAEPDDLDAVRVCGFKDAVDAFQVFLRPFVGSEFEVAFADGEIHGSFGPRKTASTLISGCFFRVSSIVFGQSKNEG